METINFMTSVSRPYNLSRILHSITQAMEGVSFRVRWILVFDAWIRLPRYVAILLADEEKVEVDVSIYDGPRLPFAIPQKNFGLARVKEGYFQCLDDDNIVHPNLLRRIEKAAAEHPTARGFIVSQRRWDVHGNLKASPDSVMPRKIDSAMSLVHKDLIGDERYLQEFGGEEDGHFIQRVYERHRGRFFFIDEILSFFNYLWPDDDRFRS